MTLQPGRVRMRLVGACLRRCREDASYNLGDAAGILGCHSSQVSRIETGQRRIDAGELRLLLDKYGTTDPATRDALAAMIPPPSGHNGWWGTYRDTLPGPYLEYASAESAACAVSAFAPNQVPELLQTPDYARAIAAADASVPQRTEAAAVAATDDRQRVTLRERQLPVDVVIGEAALCQIVGSTAVMRAQIAHLVRLPEQCPNVTVRLLPFRAGAAPAGAAGSFSVLRFGPVPAVGLVHVGGPSGGLCPDTLGAAADYLRAFAHLQALSLTPETTAARLRQLAEAEGRRLARG